MQDATLISAEPPAVSTRQKITAHLNAAQTALRLAVAEGQNASPLTTSIPAFQKMEAMGKEIGALMMEVSKMRGL